jgi:hypothetical protein
MSASWRSLAAVIQVRVRCSPFYLLRVRDHISSPRRLPTRCARGREGVGEQRRLAEPYSSFRSSCIFRFRGFPGRCWLTLTNPRNTPRRICVSEFASLPLSSIDGRTNESQNKKHQGEEIGSVAAPAQLFWDETQKKKTVKASGCAHPWIGSRGRLGLTTTNKKTGCPGRKGHSPFEALHFQKQPRSNLIADASAHSHDVSEMSVRLWISHKGHDSFAFPFLSIPFVFVLLDPAVRI